MLASSASISQMHFAEAKRTLARFDFIIKSKSLNDPKDVVLIEDKFNIKINDLNVGAHDELYSKFESPAFVNWLQSRNAWDTELFDSVETSL